MCLKCCNCEIYSVRYVIECIENLNAANCDKTQSTVNLWGVQDFTCCNLAGVCHMYIYKGVNYNDPNW